MQISAIELKTASNGKQYKALTLSEKFEGKDKTNVFAGTPYYNLNIGDAVDVSMLYINPKGYLEIGKPNQAPSGAQPTAPNPNTGIDVKLGFIAQTLKEIKEQNTRILVHIGAATKTEEAYATDPNPMPFSDEQDAPPISDQDIPF